MFAHFLAWCVSLVRKTLLAECTNLLINLRCVKDFQRSMNVTAKAQSIHSNVASIVKKKGHQKTRSHTTKRKEIKAKTFLCILIEFQDIQHSKRGKNKKEAIRLILGLISAKDSIHFHSLLSNLITGAFKKFSDRVDIVLLSYLVSAHLWSIARDPGGLQLHRVWQWCLPVPLRCHEV